jgi:type II secretion system protein H
MTLARRSIAFTLVELIIVMALMAIVMAIAAPSLARSMKERNLPDEAARILAASEYARSEAASQGVPMVVWIDSAAHRLGIEPKEGFDGEPSRTREFTWNDDIQIETEQKASSGKQATVMEFTPDGSLADSSAESVKLTDRFGNTMSLVRTSDRWSYEIVKETP